MSWTDASRYQRTVRAAEAALDTAADTAMPWGSEFASVFGSPEGLHLALLTRWRTIVEAQGEDATFAELAAAHPGLARLARVPVLVPALAS